MSLPARLRAFGISKALDYLERDPDANLPKLMDWLDKYTGERLASPYRELFHRAMSDPGNNWHRLIKSMYTDIDSRVLKKIFENFVIHAGLMDWPSRNAAGELGNGRAPWAVIIDHSFPCEMGCRGCGASIYGVRPYMEFDSLDEEIEARKGRGCHLFIFSGGNPLAREQETIALCNKHTDCVFAAFTPPRFITGELCADLLRVRNLFPAIQVDEDGADATRPRPCCGGTSCPSAWPAAAQRRTQSGWPPNSIMTGSLPPEPNSAGFLPARPTDRSSRPAWSSWRPFTGVCRSSAGASPF